MSIYDVQDGVRIRLTILQLINLSHQLRLGRATMLNALDESLILKAQNFRIQLLQTADLAQLHRLKK